MNPKAQQIAEEIYAACDEEFGAEHHYEAVRRADELVANYQVDRPKTPIQGAQLMRKVYAEVAEKHKAKEQPAAATPAELTPTSLAQSPEHKPGTLAEVRADMVQKMKAGTWKPQAFAAPS